ncbi:hypothetical protein [Nocardiopsis sp. HUAS JQ3]|uniref:TPR repeat region-containing protein n=1 Tax=Nocardiopsis sp. HUAS JQ3 TaxID=3061629 RepID=UPI0023A98D0D|nr:hypothetical protein [Nocardiopsis sp. HUAS JQ3]WDZ88840.1 hypothetical protein PV789_17930 [Nocardiopsis sp. HUAS JQ3]
MGTFDLNFNPESTDAISGLIKEDAREFERLRMRILGQSEELDTSFNSGAAAFSDGIGWDISRASAEEIKQWQDAGAAVEFCAGVTQRWGDYVQEFNLERNNLIGEWKEAKAAQEALIPEEYAGETITYTYPEAGFLGIGDGARARELFSELSDKLESLRERAKKNYDDLLDNGDECGDMLREGPTPENVRLLMEGGYTDWFFYNIDPQTYAPPIELSPDQADEWAEDLEEYWSGEREMDERYESLMLIMGMLASRARMAQEGVGEMTDDEMQILENFYATLEESRAGQGGVVEMAAYLPLEGMDPEESDRILSIIGDGIVALSNEDFGGGYDRLPESVRHTAEGYFLHEDYPSASWVRDMKNLAEIFEHVDPSLAPGEALGGALHTSIGVYFADGGPVNFDYDGFFGQVLDVAYRNEDLNFSLMKGEFEHPAVDDPTRIEVGGEPIESMEDLADQATIGLFTHDWDDGGEAMRGFSDWIVEYQDSSDPDQREMGNEALAVFLDMVTKGDFSESLNNTGEDVVETNDAGEEVTWRDVSVGHLNPAIAEGFSDIFLANMEYFANGEGLGESASPWGSESGEDRLPSVWIDEDSELWKGDHDNPRVWLNPETRLAFVQYIMGDEETAANTYAEVFEHELKSLEEFAFGNQEWSIPRDAGTLRGLVDLALENEARARVDSSEEEAEYDNKVRGIAVDVVGGIAGDLKIPGVIVEALKATAKEELEIPAQFEQQENAGSNEGAWELSHHSKIFALAALAESNEEFMNTLKTDHEGVLSEEGEFIMDFNDWEVPGDGRGEALTEIMVVAEDYSLPGSDRTASEDIETYADGYRNQRSTWEDKFPPKEDD